MNKLSFLLLLALIAAAFAGEKDGDTTKPDAPDADDDSSDDRNKDGHATRSYGNDTDTTDSSEDGEKNDAKREVDFEVKEDEVDIEASNRAGRIQDKMHFKLDIKDEGAKIDLRYYQKAADTNSKYWLKSKFFNLVEFKDANGDNQPQANEIVNTLSLGRDNWDRMPRAKAQAPADAQKTFEFRAATKDGVFSVTGHYSNAVVMIKVNGTDVALKPNAIKVDIGAKGYNYTQEGTMLAVQTRFRTRMKISEDGAKHKITTESIGAAESLKFAWADTVDCDGTAVPVTASKLEAVPDDKDAKEDDEEKDNRVWFTFQTTNRCNTLLWDPTIGVPYAPTTGMSGAASFAPSMWAAAGALVALLTMRA